MNFPEAKVTSPMKVTAVSDGQACRAVNANEGANRIRTMKTNDPDYTNGSAAYASVATLDENPCGLTCSALAVSAWAPQAALIPCGSFEDAAALTKAGKSSAFAAPAAYSKLGALLMDQALAAVAVFLFPIPALVLASAKDTLPGTVARLFHHPATAPLLPKAQVRPGKLVPMSSNTAAAVRAVETDGVCVTNSACAEHFGLRIHQVLRSKRLMPFVVFVERESNRHQTSLCNASPSPSPKIFRPALPRLSPPF